MGKSVCVLLPTLNEAGSIKEMIERVRKVDSAFTIYVVDSGSTDGTVKIAEECGAKLITLEKRGKGLAIKKAFAFISEDLAVLLDSDASYFPEEIPVVLGALGKCDVAVGSRFRGRMENGSMTTLNKFGNRMLTLLASLLYGRRISDVCSGFWAFRKSAYKRMAIDAPHFELEANFFAECAKKGLSLCEVPVSYGVRQGESKLSPLHGLGIGWYLLRKRFSRS